MKNAEAEARRVAQKLWEECVTAHGLYYIARKVAIANAEKSLELMLLTSEKAVAAYNAALAEVGKYNTPNAGRTA